MSLLGGGLGAIFGAALGAVYDDATLTKCVEADTGSGGFAVTDSAYPAKAMIESLSDTARAARGIPHTAVGLSVLQAGLPVAIDLDDAVTLAGCDYRVIEVGRDPAGAAWSLVAVPA